MWTQCNLLEKHLLKYIWKDQPTNLTTTKSSLILWPVLVPPLYVLSYSSKNIRNLSNLLLCVATVGLFILNSSAAIRFFWLIETSFCVLVRGNTLECCELTRNISIIKKVECTMFIIMQNEKNYRTISCDICDSWLHIRCEGISPKQYITQWCLYKGELIFVKIVISNLPFPKVMYDSDSNSSSQWTYSNWFWSLWTH